MNRSLDFLPSRDIRLRRSPERLRCGAAGCQLQLWTAQIETLAMIAWGVGKASVLRDRSSSIKIVRRRSRKAADRSDRSRHAVRRLHAADMRMRAVHKIQSSREHGPRDRVPSAKLAGATCKNTHGPWAGPWLAALGARNARERTLREMRLRKGTLFPALWDSTGTARCVDRKVCGRSRAVT